MSDKIQISMLGGFRMAYKDNIISDNDNRSRKIWTLLEYLITFHQKEISHSSLISLLWHNTESNVDPENALKTILHRARTSLDQLQYPAPKLIIHRKEAYYWNRNVEYELDIDLFEEACNKAEDSNLSTSERMTWYKKAFELYKGKFLPKNTGEDWVVPIAGYYHSLYLRAVHNMIDLLLADEAYDKIIPICATASNIDPYDEPIHFHFIRSLYMTGNHKKALEQYEHVIHMFYDSFGINPSKEITDLYQEIMKEEKSPVADLNIIKEHLREQNAQKTAYLCDYSVFKNLYQIEARSAARSGLSVFLCLISLTNLNPGTNNTLMANAMERMSETIAQSLRSGDVYARFSVNQYIIMLPTANYENCTTIASRILKSFQNSRPHLRVGASYALSELDPQVFAEE